MASNERNHRKTEKCMRFPTKSYENQARNNRKETKIAKKFNKYFTSVRTTLASKIPIVTKDVSE